jgi:hypothetical protein
VRLRSLAFVLVVLPCIFAQPAGDQQTSTAVVQNPTAVTPATSFRSITRLFISTRRPVSIRS